MSIKRIEETIKGIYNDDLKLYDYLYDLAYSHLDDFSYLPIYEKFLEDKRADIKSIAIKAILFMLKSKDDRYKETAIKYLSDEHEDEDLRMTCASSLAQAYIGSNDARLLKIFYNISFNPVENDYLKATCFDAMMGVIGVTSKELFERNRGVIEKFSEINTQLYNREIDKIRFLIGI